MPFSEKGADTDRASRVLADISAPQAGRKDAPGRKSGAVITATGAISGLKFQILPPNEPLRAILVYNLHQSNHYAFGREHVDTLGRGTLRGENPPRPLRSLGEYAGWKVWKMTKDYLEITVNWR